MAGLRMGDVYMGCRVAAHSSVISWHLEESTRTNLHGLGGEIQEGIGGKAQTGVTCVCVWRGDEGVVKT